MSAEREKSMGSYSEADEALAFTIHQPPVKGKGGTGRLAGAPLLSCEKEVCGEPQGQYSTVFWSRAPSPQLRGRADRGCGEVTSAHPSIATATACVSDGSS